MNTQKQAAELEKRLAGLSGKSFASLHLEALKIDDLIEDYEKAITTAQKALTQADNESDAELRALYRVRARQGVRAAQQAAIDATEATALPVLGRIRELLSGSRVVWPDKIVRDAAGRAEFAREDVDRSSMVAILAKVRHAIQSEDEGAQYLLWRYALPKATSWRPTTKDAWTGDDERELAAAAEVRGLLLQIERKHVDTKAGEADQRAVETTTRAVRLVASARKGLLESGTESYSFVPEGALRW